MSFLENLLQNQVDYFSTPLGIVVFIIFYMSWVAFLLPSSWISMFAGFIYGSLWGSVFVFMGAFLGATITFFAGRTFLKGWVQRRLLDFPKLQVVEKAISNEGLKLILLTRLSPAFPFGLLNLSYGLSNIKLKDFLVGLFAILPGTFLYCSLGSFASEISRFNEILLNRGELNTFIFTLIGLIATILVFLLVIRNAQKSLKDII